MAIQDSFNISQATTSQAYAYKCWYNYNYGGNTMGISANDMGKITQTWSGELTNWRATATNDENAYEIDDDDFSSAKENGKQNAKNKTGYDGKKSNAGAATSLGASIAATGATGVATLATGGAAAKGGGMICGIAGAAIIMANAMWCLIAKPNKEAKEACDALQDEMNNANLALTSSQEDMSAMNDELVELSDEANEYNEDANENIQKNKAEYDLYKASYDALMEKVESGESLTEEEQNLLKTLIPLMQELGINIEETSESATDTVGDIFDTMDGYQDGFDNAAETMAEVEGLTDFAAGFDEKTKKACAMTSAAQSLNAASGATLGAKLIATAGLSITRWIAGGLALAGAGISVANAAKQGKMKGQVEVEIDMRKNTQEFNTTTTDMYSEHIADYAGYMEGVEDLELEIPTEMEAPEEGATIPDENNTDPEKDEDNTDNAE